MVLIRKENFVELCLWGNTQVEVVVVVLVVFTLDCDREQY
jgi:hypothetical protein